MPLEFGYYVHNNIMIENKQHLIIKQHISCNYVQYLCVIIKLCTYQ